jgi:hypothetical protein
MAESTRDEVEPQMFSETGLGADEDDEGGAEGAGSELPLKKLEAMYAMRHMKSAQHKLQVLHHINALVALRRRLLRDEEEEEAMAASSVSLVTEMAVPAADGRVGGAFREARQAGGPGEVLPVTIKALLRQRNECNIEAEITF